MPHARSAVPNCASGTGAQEPSHTVRTVILPLHSLCEQHELAGSDSIMSLTSCACLAAGERAGFFLACLAILSSCTHPPHPMHLRPRAAACSVLCKHLHCVWNNGLQPISGVGGMSGTPALHASVLSCPRDRLYDTDVCACGTARTVGAHLHRVTARGWARAGRSPPCSRSTFARTATAAAPPSGVSGFQCSPALSCLSN